MIVARSFLNDETIDIHILSARFLINFGTPERARIAMIDDNDTLEELTDELILRLELAANAVDAYIECEFALRNLSNRVGFWSYSIRI